MDRDLIRKNEFGWVLENNISELDRDGMLPPRFAGLAGGAMLRQIPRATPPNKRRKTGGWGAVASSAQEVEFYSELALPPDSAREAQEVSERGKYDLVRRWLRRSLYEEVQEQVTSPDKRRFLGVRVYLV